MSEAAIPAPAAPQKKKGGALKKMLVMLIALIVVGGGGAAGGLYAMNGSIFGGGGHAEEIDPDQPQLVVREGVSSEAAAEGRARARNGAPDPRVFKATYHPMEGNFTSNLRGGEAFVQVGLGVSTFYDEKVIANLTTHEMAIRSAVILTLSEADPLEITTLQGKEALKQSLRNAINGVLTNREGFGGIDDVYFTSFVTQ